MESPKLKSTRLTWRSCQKNPDSLPKNISQEFLKLQKQEILEDLQEQMKKKKAAPGTSNIHNDALSTNNNINRLSSSNLESK
jgi:hypothetical protein